MSANEPLTTTEEHHASSDAHTAEGEDPKRSRISKIYAMLKPANVPRHLIFVLLFYNIGFIFQQMFFGKWIQRIYIETTPQNYLVYKRLFLAHPAAPKLNGSRLLFYSFFSVGMLVGSVFIYQRIVSIAERNRTKRWYKNGKLTLNIFVYCWILMAHSIMIFVNIPLPETFFFPVIWCVSTDSIYSEAHV